MTADLGARILKLMRELDYQINTSEHSTIGACPACPDSSRDGLLCAECLTKELGYIVGDRLASEYTDAHRRARKLRRQMLHHAIENSR